MKSQTFAVLLIACATAAHANTLYKCTDDLGHSTYTNFKAQNRNCVVLSRDMPTSVAASKPARSSAPSPSDFPKVSSETQRSRDSDRRQIVEQELSNEQKNLAEAKKILAEQEAGRAPQESLKPFRDRIALHERNLVELQRELSKLR
jgi:predicted transcriptional regulator